MPWPRALYSRPKNVRGIEQSATSPKQPREVKHTQFFEKASCRHTLHYYCVLSHIPSSLRLGARSCHSRQLRDNTLPFEEHSSQEEQQRVAPLNSDTQQQLSLLLDDNISVPGFIGPIVHFSTRRASSLRQLNPYHELKLHLKANLFSLADFLKKTCQFDHRSRIFSQVISSAVNARDAPFVLKFLKACRAQCVPISADDYCTIWDLARPDENGGEEDVQLHLGYAERIFYDHLLLEITQNSVLDDTHAHRLAALEFATLLARYRPKLAHNAFCVLSGIDQFFSSSQHQLLRTLLLIRLFMHVEDLTSASSSFQTLECQCQNLLDNYKERPSNARILAFVGETLTQIYLDDVHDVEKATYFANHPSMYSLDHQYARDAYLRSQMYLVEYWANAGEVEQVKSVFQLIGQKEPAIFRNTMLGTLYYEYLIISLAKSNSSPSPVGIDTCLAVLRKAGPISTRVFNALLEYRQKWSAEVVVGGGTTEAEIGTYLNHYACLPSADTFGILSQPYVEEPYKNKMVRIFADACSWNALNSQLYRTLFQSVFMPMAPSSTARTRLYLSGLLGQYEKTKHAWDTDSINLVLGMLLRFGMLGETIEFFQSHHKSNAVFLNTHSVNVLFQAILLQRGRPNANYMALIFDSLVENAFQMRHSVNRRCSEDDFQFGGGTNAEKKSEPTTVTPAFADRDAHFVPLGHPSHVNSPAFDGNSPPPPPKLLTSRGRVTILSPKYNPKMVPDSRTFEYRSLCGNVDERLLLLMKQLGLIPSHITFKALLESAMRHGDAALTLQILAEYVAYHPEKVNDVTIQSVITCFVNLGAQSLFKPLKNLTSGLLLSPETHLLLRSVDV